MNDLPQWSEQQWKNEIHKQEKQLALFFQDLVYCLDLPISELPAELPGSVETPSDPVTAGKTAALQQWMREHEEECDENELEEDYEPRHPVCFSCVDSLDQLATAWNIFSSDFKDGELSRYALGASCAFAKLLARSADFMEPSKYSTPQLLLSLGNLALNDLEDVIYRLESCQNQLDSHAESFNYFYQRLAVVKEQITARINEMN